MTEDTEEKFRADKALLIILGASNWPNHERYKNELSLIANPFQNSANGVENYFVQKIKLPEGKVKNLFGSDKTVDEQLQEIKSFLEQNGKNEEGDLFIYSVGHGEVQENDYRLFVKNSTTDFNTAISFTRLIDYIRKNARDKRCYIIIDACYAGIVRRIMPETPHGIVSFCASPEKPVKWHSENLFKPTLFTGTLLEVLKAGKVTYPEFLSCNEINLLLDSYLKGRSEPELEPQYYVIGKKQQIIGNIKIFPNPDYRLPISTNSLPCSMDDIKGLPSITWHITTSNKGGVGKTLLSMMLLTNYSSDIATVLNPNIPVKLPLVIDLNGVNTDLRRLLVTKNNLELDEKYNPLYITLNDEKLCIVRVNQQDHPFFLGWLVDDPFRMLNTQSFFKLLAVIKKEGIKKIKNEFNIDVDTVIIDTNYHFCNIFSDKDSDYLTPIADKDKTLKDFLWDRDQFFIWFIWVYGQIRNLTPKEWILPFTPDVKRMTQVSICVERYLTSKNNNPKTSPFRHIINSIGVVDRTPTKEQKKNAKAFWTKVKGWMQDDSANGKFDFEGTTIEQLTELMLLPRVSPKAFADVQNKMVKALQKARDQIQTMKGSTDSGVGEEVIDEGKEFKKMLSELKEVFIPWGGRPKNFVPICTYHHQLVSYQDYEFIPLTLIKVLKIYRDFQQLLPEDTE